MTLGIFYILCLTAFLNNVFLAGCTSVDRTYYIEPENGTYPCPDPCLTLNEFAQTNTSFISSLTLVFLPGSHQLVNMSFVMDSKNNVTLEAAAINEISIRCIGQSSFLFRSLSNLQLTNLTFVSCSEYAQLPGIAIESSKSVALTNIKLTNSTAGAMYIFNSTAVIVSMTCSYNTGNFSNLKLSSSKVSFQGSCMFSHNTALNQEDIGGIGALNSNLSFSGNTSFVENVAANPIGVAALFLTGCTMYLIGEIHVLYNFGPQPVYVQQSVIFSQGVIQFVGNQAEFDRYSAEMNEVILKIVSSLFYLDGTLDYSKNYGSAIVLNTPFTVVGKVQVDSNVLVQDYFHSILSLSGSTVNWNGEVIVSNNEAKNTASAGISSFGQSVHVNGNISFLNNHADHSTGYFIASSSLIVDGCVCINSNSALTQAVGLTLSSSNVSFNGLVDISNNTANSDNSAIVVIQFSQLSVNGYLNFSDNVALNRAFCTLSAFSNCTFNGTVLFQNSLSERSPHYFQTCMVTFMGDTTIANNFAATASGGGIGLSRSLLMLSGSYSFINNMSPTEDGGGIYAIDSTVILSDKGTFENNTAIHGGGIHLFYRSRLVLRPDLSVTFKRNTALGGGAINVEEVVSFINCTNDIRLRFDYSSPPVCFFDAGNNVTLTFEDNDATDGGSALYGGMLNRCVPSSPQNRSVLDVFLDISHFNDTNSRNQTAPALSSEPFQLCFCEDQQPDCQIEERMIRARRGEQFSVSVSALDQLNVNIVALVRSYLVSGFNDTDKILGDEGILQKVNNSCTNLFFRVFSPNVFEQLIMYAEGPCRDVGNASKSLHIDLLECPDGFVLQIDRCICDPRLSEYTNACNIDTGGIERPTNFWVGATYDENNTYSGLILYPNCPFDYCMWPSAEVVLPIPDTQCDHNRSGLLCGACLTNTSLLLGGSECSHCSNLYLLMLVPFAVMGVLLVAGLFILHLTVATGSLHGVIFYANIVIVNKAVFVPPGTFKGFSLFLSWLNLDLGIETCFYEGMDQYAKTWLQFLFPSYLLVLVFLIIILCHFSIRASRLFGGNPVAVLATVILLSYTKIIRNILAALSFATLDYPDDSIQVWLYDGNLIYLQGKHAALFAVGLLVLICFVLPYTFLLLSGQILKRVPHISSSSCFMNLNPFIDAYHAPYRDHHRYWTGLFLLLRCVLLVTFALNSLGDPSVNLLAITTVCFVVGTLSWIIGGVYSQRILDALEAAFILNLGMFAAATYHTRASVGGNQAVAANISIGIAFLLFLAIVIAQIVIRLMKKIRSTRKNDLTPIRQEANETNQITFSGEGYGTAQNVNGPTFQDVPPPGKNIEMDFSGVREPLLDED